MEDFRPETFTQFIRTQKPIWFLRIIWIGAAIILVVEFIFTFQNRQDVFWSSLIFILIGLFAQALFFYFMAYRMYSYGRKAYVDLKHQNVIIVRDVNVFIRGFDLLSKNSFFNLDVSKTIYQFEQADIIFGTVSMILLGKGKQFGSISFASPVEIVTSKKQTSIANAKLLNWTEQKGRIVIEIKDEYYTKPFKIEFKDHVEQIKLWLPATLKN